jgi:uncharacterized protein (TIRG00374 family)
MDHDGDDMLEADPTDRPRRSQLVRWSIGIAIGLVAAWVAVSAAGGLADAASALRQLNAWWLLPAFLIEAASYVVLGAKLRRLVGASVVTGVEAIEMGLVLSGFGLLTPASPAEGIALTAAHLRNQNVTKRRITIIFGFSEWFSARVFLFVSAINLLAVLVIERSANLRFWPYASLAVVVIGLLAASGRLVARPTTLECVSLIVGALRRPSRRRPVAERRATGAAWYRESMEFVGTPRQRAAIAGLTAGAMLGDVSCLWFALLAAGAHVGFDVALLAISVSAVSVLVPFIPGGIGIAEAAIPAVTHHFGVPYDLGLAAALAYRGLGTFLPAGLGAIAIWDLRRHVSTTSA